MMTFEPLFFKPNLHPVVWGGNRLRPYKGMAPSADPIGESWEVSTVPSSTSIVSGGTWDGRNLSEVIAMQPEAILGHAVYRKYGPQLPLLVKFIDARSDLSIQVHPDDEMAWREHRKMGKSEMWYVINANPGSFLYAGFRQEITPEEYRRRIADGTITDVLARHEVRAGDVFYIPAGRVHAICGGILLAEVQQSSDVTYRIYDYNRPDMDGQPRELHTSLAAKALDYHVEQQYLTEYTAAKDRAVKIVDTPNFGVRVMQLTAPFHRNLLKYDSFIITMCIAGDCTLRLRANGSEYLLREGHSALIPAATADYDVLPLHGTTRLLDAFIDNMDHSLTGTLNRILHFTPQ